jgi:DNA-binding transcriptional MerR regulator
VDGYTIGQLAKATGMPVKTIRYYSDIGLLPESGRTSGGYRIYSERDQARLELARTLRELGLDLATVRHLLECRVTLADVLCLHLEAVETRLRSLQRIRAVLRAVLERGDPAEADLRRLHALSRLGAADAAELVDAFVADVGGGLPARQKWLAGFGGAWLPELSADPTTEQLDAWLELVELISDPEFRASLRAMSEGFWKSVGEYDRERSHAANQAVLAAVGAAIERGIAPADSAADDAVGVFVATQAELLGRSDGPDFRTDLLRGFDEHDPRAERHWELIAIINGTPWPPPQQRVYAWLAAALRHRAP